MLILRELELLRLEPEIVGVVFAWTCGSVSQRSGAADLDGLH